MSCNLAMRSVTLEAISCNLSLSLLSMAPDSPMARSNFILMPPLGPWDDSHDERPLVEEGTKHILWSPDSWDVKVKRPEEEPRWETMRWLLSKTSYFWRGHTGISHCQCLATAACSVVESARCAGGKADCIRGEEDTTYIDGNEDVDSTVLLPRIHSVVILFGGVVSYDERVLGKFLEEALGRGAVDEEVESLCGRGQRQEREETLHSFSPWEASATLGGESRCSVGDDGCEPRRDFRRDRMPKENEETDGWMGRCLTLRCDHRKSNAQMHKCTNTQIHVCSQVTTRSCHVQETGNLPCVSRGARSAFLAFWLRAPPLTVGSRAPLLLCELTRHAKSRSVRRLILPKK